MNQKLVSCIWIVVLLAAPLAAYPRSTRENSQSPSAVVKTLQTALIQVMKDAEELGYAGRYERLKPVILATHQLDASARIALGKHWRELDERKRELFVRRFTELGVATYATNFDGYAGEHFEDLSEEPLESGSGRMVVRSRLERPGEEDVSFVYVLSRADGAWKIINIIAEGVSDLALKRAQYDSVITREGFDSLIEQLVEKIRQYAEKEEP